MKGEDIQLCHFYIPAYRIKLAKRYAKGKGQSLSQYLRAAVTKQIKQDKQDELTGKGKRKAFGQAIEAEIDDTLTKPVDRLVAAFRASDIPIERARIIKKLATPVDKGGCGIKQARLVEIFNLSKGSISRMVAMKQGFGGPVGRKKGVAQGPKKGKGSDDGKVRG